MKSRIINHLKTKHYIHEFRNVTDLHHSVMNTERGKRRINDAISDNDKWVFGEYGTESLEKVLSGINDDFKEWLRKK